MTGHDHPYPIGGKPILIYNTTPSGRLTPEDEGFIVGHHKAKDHYYIRFPGDPDVYVRYIEPPKG